MNQAEFEIDFLVHSSQVGGIIGRAGYKIKELRDVSFIELSDLLCCS